MLSIPGLPTDNLYKFMAIFGLIVFLSSAYFPLKEALELELRGHEVISRGNMLILAMHEINHEQKILIEDMAQAVRKEYGERIYEEFVKASRDNDTTAFAEFRLRLEDMNREALKHPGTRDTLLIMSLIMRSIELDDEVFKIKLKEEQMQRARNEWETLSEHQKFWNMMAKIGMIIGVALLFVGFRLWYVLLQKPQDILIKKQLDSESIKNSEVSKKRRHKKS